MAWETESGLEERYPGKVVDAWFDEGTYAPVLKLEIDSPAFEATTEHWYSCGKRVSLVSDGEVDLSSSKSGNFHENSAVGELIKSIVPHETVLKQIADNGDPKFAKSWIGLDCIWERVEHTNTINGEKKSYSRMVCAGPIDGGKEVEEYNPPKWLVTVCAESDTYEEFLSAAMADDRVSDDDRRAVLNKEFWDFS